MESKTTKPAGRSFMKPAISLIAILLCCVFLCSCQFGGNPLFKYEDAEYDIMENLLINQKETDERISKELSNDKNTFDNPLVIENPYLISPLSAIVIFTTDEETPIDVTINDQALVRFETSTRHAIPIYGMYDDYDNKILLTDNKGNTKTLNITTEKASGARIDVRLSDESLSDEFYLVSPDYEYTSAYDKNGRLLWYLNTADNEGAVVFNGDGRFLISDPYQGTGGIRINYSSFMEMDYLGKVRKINLTEYGYHHEIVPIKNNTEYLIPGHDEDSPFMQAILYTIDAKTAKPTNVIDFYSVFHDIAPEWTDSYTKDDKFNFVINGVDYDEKTGDAIISVRSFGMLIRINLESRQIKWIFTDPKDKPEELMQYILKPADDTRYPYGQHEPKFLADGTISYHNNNIDFLGADLHLSKLRNSYASNEILQIDEDKKEVRTLWSYDANKEIISRMSGSFEFLEDGHKLISYGSALKEEYWDSKEDFIVTDNKYTEGLMMELDENDKVLWKAGFPGVIHKVYRSTFYDNEVFLNESSADTANLKETANYDTESLDIADGQDIGRHDGEEFDVKAVSDELKNAQKWKGDFHHYLNRAIISPNYKPEDEIKLLYVDENNNGRIFDYKKANEKLPIVNSQRYGPQVTGLTGKQKVYLLINGVYYDTGNVIMFEW